jgi:DNA mismatch endonuclease, patch repair protein
MDPALCYTYLFHTQKNQEFWAKKLQQNKDHDKFVTRELKKAGWKVVRVWEHELKSAGKVAGKIKKTIISLEG